MSELYKKVVEYEEQLAKLRKEISAISIGDGATEDMIKDKVMFLQAEVNHVNYQLGLVKKAVEEGKFAAVTSVTEATPQEEVAQPQQVDAPVNVEPVGAAPVNVEPVGAAPVNAESVNVEPVNVEPVNVAPVNIAPAQPKPKRDFEKTFGKSWMAIIASVLIFASVVMFATVLIPTIGVWAKIALMVGFSAGLTVFGLVMTLKNRDNKLYQALLGCGSGCIFISTIVSYFLLGLVHPFFLYPIILAWCIGMCFLGRLNSLLFKIIGQIGVGFAIIYGGGLATFDGASENYIAMAIFFFASQIAFVLIDRNRSETHNIVTHIAMIHGSIWILALNESYDYPAMVYVLIAFLVAYVAGNLFMVKHTQKNIVFSICTTLLLIIVFIADRILHLRTVDWAMVDINVSPLAYIVAVLVVALTFISKANKYNKNIIKISAVVITAIFAAVNFNQFFAVAVVGVLAMLAAFILKDELLRWVGSGMAVAALFINTADLLWLYAVVAVVTIALAVFANLRKYYGFVKMVMTVLVITMVINIMHGAFGELVENTSELGTIVLFIEVCICIALAKTPFSKNWITREKEKGMAIFFYVINGCLMLVAIPLLFLANDMHILVEIAAAALVAVNVMDQIKSKRGFFNAFVGIKITLFVILSMASYHAEQIWISGACIILAIISIVLGFVIKKKALRIFGLILANVSIAKLVLIDISYDNLMQRAIGFFVCGVLCFAISFVYNRIEKKNGAQEVPRVDKTEDSV